MAEITILMATYNGERFLREQLDSLFSQTEQDFRLIVSDDCSTDGTADILREYKNRYPEKMRCFIRRTNSGKASANFFSLLKAERNGMFGETSPYIMCCDQDDIWLPEKVEKTLGKMHDMERRYGNVPLLVHGDLMLVDENGEHLNDSMFHYQKLLGAPIPLNLQLIQNSVTGCTLMVNRALLSKMRRIPGHAIMHDWWLALIAAAFGKIGFMETPYICYRQHGNNSEGAKDYTHVSSLAKLAAHRSGIKESLQKTYLQASEFYRIYKLELSPEARREIGAFANIPARGYVGRVHTIRKYDFWKSDRARKLGQIFFT